MSDTATPGPYEPTPSPTTAPANGHEHSQMALPTINIVNTNTATAVAGGAYGTKQVSHAYLWWFFLGALGAHKFYLGKTGMGVLYIFTGGLFLVGLVYDLFTLGRQVRTYNARGY